MHKIIYKSNGKKLHSVHVKELGRLYMIDDDDSLGALEDFSDEEVDQFISSKKVEPPYLRDYVSRDESENK